MGRPTKEQQMKRGLELEYFGDTCTICERKWASHDGQDFMNHRMRLVAEVYPTAPSMQDFIKEK